MFVCSYPKSGTTWMQAILAQIVTDLERDSTFAHVSEVSPFFEIDPHWDPDDERRLSPWERGASLAEGSLHDGLRLPALGISWASSVEPGCSPL